MTTQTALRTKDAAYWYRMHVGECPCCGKDKSRRERVVGARPSRREDRVRYLSDGATVCAGCPQW